jgi:hypothetical protein
VSKHGAMIESTDGPSLPPGDFVSEAMVVAVMASAQGYRELIAHIASHRAELSETAGGERVPQTDRALSDRADGCTTSEERFKAIDTTDAGRNVFSPPPSPNLGGFGAPRIGSTVLGGRRPGPF